MNSVYAGGMASGHYGAVIDGTPRAATDCRQRPLVAAGHLPAAARAVHAERLPARHTHSRDP